jgi:hypothetical protein
MASYLDYLFPAGEYPQQAVPGLLSEEEMLKNRQAAQTSGLLAMGLGTIMASAPSSQRQGVLQTLAPGIMAGQQAYQGTLQQQQQMLAARAKALEPKTVSVKGDETVYTINKATGKPELYLQGEGSSPKDFQKGLALAGLPVNLKPENVTPQQLAMVNAALKNVTPGGTNVTLSTEKTYGGAFAGKIADQDSAMLDAARRAPMVLESVQRSKSILEGDKVFTGSLANQKLELAKFGQAIGATGKNTDELVANTQGLMSTRAQATLDSIRASGLGAGQGFTDKDRQFLENAKLGNITYSKKALEQQLDIEERVARGSVDAWNTRSRELPKSAKEPLGIGEVTLPKQETQTTKRKVYNPATGKVE